MTVDVEKSGKILENCDADLENAYVDDTGYYSCFATVLAFHLSTVADQAFPVVAAGVWNSLPVQVTSAATLNTFKQRLKTELFIRCYDLPSSYARKHSL